MDFRFKTIDSVRELKLVRDFLIMNALWYPAYEHWVDKVCVPDIEGGLKTVILAFYNNYLIGDAIYQQHKELPRTREFKNMRIHPGYRRRDVGHFLLRQVEEEGDGFDRVILDVDSRQQGIINFLTYCGYRKIAGVNLYCPDNLDYVMVKEFKRSGPGQI